MCNEALYTRAMNSSEAINAKPFPLLILGGGAVVLECHLPALRALGWLEQCMIVEPFERNAALTRSRFPSVKVISEPYDRVLSDPSRLKDFEGALIALPNTFHKTATLQCIRESLPVICEKPLALTSTECLEIQQAMESIGTQVVVGMVRRQVPSLKALRAAIREGLIGEVTSVTLEMGSDCRHWPWDTETVLRRDQGGCLINLGIHFLDMLELIFGRLKPLAYTDDYAGGIEVNCDLRLETASGVPVGLRISWTHTLGNALRVQGTRGTLAMDLGQYEKAVWRSSDGGLESTLVCPRPFDSGDWQASLESCFAEQLWQFAAAVRRGGTCEGLVTPSEAALTHQVIEWAYHRRPVRTISLAPSRRPQLPPAAVVVTGGTGFVGSHLVERLAELEMTSITVPVRTFRTGGQVARYPMVMKRIDLLSIDSCRESLRGAKFAFHLAYGSSGSSASEVTIIGTRNILTAALAEGVGSVVVFGTCSVWAGYDNQLVNEGSPVKPGLGAYGKAKAQMQAECLEFARRHPQMQVCVVAPGAVYGPRGGLFCRTPRLAAKAGRFAWFEGGSGTCNYVHVKNLVDLALLAVQRPQAHQQVLIGVDGYTSWREFLTPLVLPWLHKIPDISMEEVRRLAALPARTGTTMDLLRAGLNSPDFMAKLSNHRVLGTLKQWLADHFPSSIRKIQKLRTVPEMIRKPSPAETAPFDAWMADIYGPETVSFDGAKARRLLEWESQISLADGMVQSVEWLRQTEFRN